jgi:hypothetical protein
LPFIDAHGNKQRMSHKACHARHCKACKDASLGVLAQNTFLWF